MLVANFREDITNTIFRTYMEAFMHWFMNYRTDKEVIDLFEDIALEEMSNFKISTDPACNICFAHLQKK